MSKPVEFSASQVIGIVESVSPSEITVRLDHTAPQATALNAGHLQRFPRINGWVLVPSEVGYLIGTVTWIGIENAPYPRPARRADDHLVDLPFPQRRMKVTPLGTLRWRNDQGGSELVRGILSYPSVGEPVLVPTAEQLRAVAQATSPNAHVRIGTSPLAGDVDVRVDPDRLFGRHLAVLGNTGSGKSCTVAGLIRWSLEAAAEALPTGDPGPNARFIVLDPNGEYGQCFSDLSDVRVFRPEPDETRNEVPLTVPAWIWSSAEWAAITRASMQTQRPLLQQTLRQLRNGIEPGASTEQMLAIHLRGFASIWQSYLADPASYAKFPRYKELTRGLEGMKETFQLHSDSGFALIVGDLLTALATAGEAHQGQYDQTWIESEVRGVVDALDDACSRLDVSIDVTTRSEDAPYRFDLDRLPDHIQALSRTGDYASAAGHASFLIARMRALLSDLRLRDIICPKTEQSLVEWLTDVVGAEDASNGQIAIIDLSLLASEVVHTVVGVLGRIIMEALQYVRRLTGKDFPTVLVLEEAHNFIGAGTGASDIPSTADLCRETFERIAREGRKFGLGLVISSQRPSALSPTVLSQCNTFLLHRLVNDRDQDLVGRMVPDALGDLLHELPSLPSAQAILLGWATPVPALVEITSLPESQRPRSSDPQFWETWTRRREVEFTWQEVTDAWVGAEPAPQDDH